ncbi:MAG: hypothetical protein Q8J68_08530 [Methanolobus sp.]|uniref:hypothetical protein n=1 Tax=Methanolobus sp. TaxID=1874737 RepID=UPI002730AAB4|nr:hypothetical protein [Methanolobus sp.]MDP2217316.1 hypothetical protein [Methanolobus sp.]
MEINQVVILIILSSLIAILGNVAGLIKPDYHKKISLISILLIIVFTSLSIHSYYQEIERLKYEKDSGFLQVEKLVYPNIYLGSNAAVNTPDGVDFSSAYDFAIPLNVRIDNGYLKVSTIIRDAEGDIIAVINDNNWQVTSRSLDKNFDQAAFEVIDSKNNVVFQVYTVNNEAYVNGVFPREDGYFVVANETGCRLGTANPNEIYIQKIFKYPSFAYPGIRI